MRKAPRRLFCGWVALKLLWASCNSLDLECKGMLLPASFLVPAPPPSQHSTKESLKPKLEVSGIKWESVRGAPHNSSGSS